MIWKKSTDSEEKGFPFSIPRMGKQQWLILLLVGVLLAIIAMPVKKGEEESLSSGGFISAKEYQEENSEKEQMERELETLLNQVEGVGTIRVMLTLKDTSDEWYGVSDSAPVVSGVLIAAQGADNLSVVENIQEAVQALFQVEAHKIKVMKMK